MFAKQKLKSNLWSTATTVNEYTEHTIDVESGFRGASRVCWTLELTMESLRSVVVLKLDQILTFVNQREYFSC